MSQKNQITIGTRTFFADSPGRPASPIEGWPVRPRRPREKKIVFRLTKIFGINTAKKVRGSQFSNQIENLERIGIDARFFGPKQKGLGRYVQKLVEGLERVLENEPYPSTPRRQRRRSAQGIISYRLSEAERSEAESKAYVPNYQFIIFLRRENWNEYQPKNPHFKKVLADYKWYSLKEQIFMPFKIWREKIDLMHFPHFNLPIFCPAPFVVTIHDLVLKKFPTRRASTLGPILYWLKNLAYRLVIWLAIKKSERIITVSHYTKNDILKYFKIKPEKIKVVYEGAPVILRAKLEESRGKNSKSTGSFGRPPAGGLSQDDDLIKKKFNITKPYLLYVGNAYPHKNLERLILAFSKIKNQESLRRQSYGAPRFAEASFGFAKAQSATRIKNQGYQLVLVGEIDYFYNRLKEFVHNSKFIIHDSVVFTDFVSDEQLKTLYQNASLYVFPSLGEGFGLPPLEAMAYGLPVVSSKAACLPEILGKAALFFNPEDIDEMAKVIKYVLENKKYTRRINK